MHKQIAKAIHPFRILWEEPIFLCTLAVLAIAGWFIYPEAKIEVHRVMHEAPANGVYVHEVGERPLGATRIHRVVPTSSEPNT